MEGGRRPATTGSSGDRLTVPHTLNQDILARLIRTPGAAEKDLAQLLGLSNAAGSPQQSASSMLKLNRKQHDVMCALASCQDVAAELGKVKPQVYMAVHEVYGIDRVTFTSWFKSCKVDRRKGKRAIKNSPKAQKPYTTQGTQPELQPNTQVWTRDSDAENLDFVEAASQQQQQPPLWPDWASPSKSLQLPYLQAAAAKSRFQQPVVYGSPGGKAGQSLSPVPVSGPFQRLALGSPHAEYSQQQRHYDATREQLDGICDAYRDQQPHEQLELRRSSRSEEIQPVSSMLCLTKSLDYVKVQTEALEACLRSHSMPAHMQQQHSPISSSSFPRDIRAQSLPVHKQQGGTPNSRKCHSPALPNSLLNLMPHKRANRGSCPTTPSLSVEMSQGPHQQQQEEQEQRHQLLNPFCTDMQTHQSILSEAAAPFEGSLQQLSTPEAAHLKKCPWTDMQPTLLWQQQQEQQQQEQEERWLAGHAQQQQLVKQEQQQRPQQQQLTEWQQRQRQQQLTEWQQRQQRQQQQELMEQQQLQQQQQCSRWLGHHHQKDGGKRHRSGSLESEAFNMMLNGGGINFEEPLTTKMSGSGERGMPDLDDFDLPTVVVRADLSSSSLPPAPQALFDDDLELMKVLLGDSYETKAQHGQFSDQAGGLACPSEHNGNVMTDSSSMAMGCPSQHAQLSSGCHQIQVAAQAKSRQSQAAYLSFQQHMAWQQPAEAFPHGR